MNKRNRLIQVTKLRSNQSQSKIVIEDNLNREFFRFENKRLVEYDCTKYIGSSIYLTDEEKIEAKKLINFEKEEQKNVKIFS